MRGWTSGSSRAASPSPTTPANTCCAPPGSDLGLLTAEVAKLSSLETTGPIDRETVGSLVGIRFGETVEDWRDAVLRDDTARAIALVPQVLALSGVSGVRLVTLLGTSLLVLRWGRCHRRGEEDPRSRTGRAGQELRCSGCARRWGAIRRSPRSWARWSGRWSLPRLRTAIAATLAADAALKSTTISDEGGIVTDLVLMLATSRARKAA